MACRSRRGLIAGAAAILVPLSLLTGCSTAVDQTGQTVVTSVPTSAESTVPESTASLACQVVAVPLSNANNALASTSSDISAEVAKRIVLSSALRLKQAGQLEGSEGLNEAINEASSALNVVGMSDGQVQGAQSTDFASAEERILALCSKSDVDIALDSWFGG